LSPDLVPSGFIDTPQSPGPFIYDVIAVDVQGHESTPATISSDDALPRIVGWPWRAGDRHGLRNSPEDIAGGLTLVWSAPGHSGTSNLLAVDRFGTLYSRLIDGSLQALDSKTGTVKWTSPDFILNGAFTVLDPFGSLYQLRSTGIAGGELIAFPKHDGPLPPSPRWIKTVLSGEILVPLIMGRDGTLIIFGLQWVELPDPPFKLGVHGPPFFRGINPADGETVWQVNDVRFAFPAMDCRKPARFFNGAGLFIGAFSLTTTGLAPIPFTQTFSGTLDTVGLTPLNPPCTPVVGGMPIVVNPNGSSVLTTVVVFEFPKCTRDFTTPIRSKIILLDTSDPVPELGNPTKLRVIPPGNINANLSFGFGVQSHMGAAVARGSDGAQRAFLGTRDGFLRVVNLTTLASEPSRLVSLGKIIAVPAISADRWLIAGAGSTIAPEIIVMDLDTGQVFESMVSPSQVVLPPSIGLDGFWYTVDVAGTLRAFDVPDLPEGPLPPEELDEEDEFSPEIVHERMDVENKSAVENYHDFPLDPNDIMTSTADVDEVSLGKISWEIE